MAITFPTRTDEQYFEAVGDAIISREHEFMHYQLNIDNYEDILQALPEEWPHHLAHLRGMNREELAAHVPDEHAALAVDCSIADQLRHAVKVERHAQRIVKLVYDALLRRLPEWSAKDIIDAAAERHKRRLTASESKGATFNLTLSPETASVLEHIKALN